MIWPFSLLQRRRRRTSPTARRGLPPDAAICVCTGNDPEPCFAVDHQVVWEGNTFIGTRCKRHGGHKFARLAAVAILRVDHQDRNDRYPFGPGARPSSRSHDE